MSSDPTVLLRKDLHGSLNTLLTRVAKFYTHLPQILVTVGKFLNLTWSYFLAEKMETICHSKRFKKAKIPLITTPVPLPTKFYLINNYFFFFNKGVIFLLGLKLQKTTSITTNMTLLLIILIIPCCITVDKCTLCPPKLKEYQRLISETSKSGNYCSR